MRVSENDRRGFRPDCKQTRKRSIICGGAGRLYDEYLNILSVSPAARKSLRPGRDFFIPTAYISLSDDRYCRGLIHAQNFFVVHITRVTRIKKKQHKHTNDKKCLGLYFSQGFFLHLLYNILQQQSNYINIPRTCVTTM